MMDNSGSPDDRSFFATHPDRDLRLHMAGSADIGRAGLADKPKPGRSVFMRLVLRGPRDLAHASFIRLMPEDDVPRLSGKTKAELLTYFIAPFAS
jgi:hypothetical protein